MKVSKTVGSSRRRRDLPLSSRRGDAHTSIGDARSSRSTCGVGADRRFCSSEEFDSSFHIRTCSDICVDKREGPRLRARLRGRAGLVLKGEGMPSNGPHVPPPFLSNHIVRARPSRSPPPSTAPTALPCSIKSEKVNRVSRITRVYSIAKRPSP